MMCTCRRMETARYDRQDWTIPGRRARAHIRPPACEQLDIGSRWQTLCAGRAADSRCRLEHYTQKPTFAGSPAAASTKARRSAKQRMHLEISRSGAGQVLVLLRCGGGASVGRRHLGCCISQKVRLSHGPAVAPIKDELARPVERFAARAEDASGATAPGVRARSAISAKKPSCKATNL